MIQVNQETNWLIQQAKNNPDSTAIVSAKGQLTYKELYEKSSAIAIKFNNYGIQSNDHIAVISKNSLEFVLIIFASWLKGCIPVVINERLTSGNIEKIISHSDSKLVIHGDKSFDIGDEFNSVSINELFESSSENARLNDITNRVAALIYTSGTTGDPKGVPVTFSCLYKSVSAIDAIDNYSDTDRFLLSLPLYHIGGFSILARSLLAGAVLVIPDEFNLSTVNSKLNEYEPGIVSVVPTMLKVLVDEATVLSESIRIIYVGGGPGDSAIIKKAIGMKYPVVKVYGSTETCAMITYADGEVLRENPDSSGEVIGNSKIEILNEDKELVDSGTIGEIVIQSDSLFEGYHKNEILTERKIINGKYFSGDIGYLDVHGNLIVESRREDLIVTGGENVFPGEIVSQLNKHSAILDSAVFGTEDAHWGQIVCAAVVTINNETVTAEEITQFLKKKLPSFKIPKQYYFVNSLPYNDLGKINVGKLKGSLNLNG